MKILLKEHNLAYVNFRYHTHAFEKFWWIPPQFCSELLRFSKPFQLYMIFLKIKRLFFVIFFKSYTFVVEIWQILDSCLWSLTFVWACIKAGQHILLIYWLNYRLPPPFPGAFSRVKWKVIIREIFLVFYMFKFHRRRFSLGTNFRQSIEMNLCP